MYEELSASGFRGEISGFSVLLKGGRKRLCLELFSLVLVMNSTLRVFEREQKKVCKETFCVLFYC